MYSILEREEQEHDMVTEYQVYDANALSRAYLATMTTHKGNFSSAGEGILPYSWAMT